MLIFWILLGSTLLYIVQRGIYSVLWSRGLRLSLRFDSAAVSEGDDVAVTERTENRKWLPLPMLSYEYTLSRNFAGVTETGAKPIRLRRKVALPGRRAAVNRTAIQGLPRGLYTVIGAKLSTSDLFYTIRRERESLCTARLMVYPAKIPAEKLSLPFRQLLGSVLTRRMAQEDPFQLKGIRQYEIYDSLRSIIVLNRRVMALFAILGALILAAVPWLLQWQGERVAPVETQGTAAAVAVTTTEFETVTKMPTDIVVTTAGEPLDYSGVGDVLTWLFVAVIGCILVLIVVALVLGLLSISDGNPKHTDPEPDQTWTLERLEPGDLGKQAEEPAVGYEKKLRRRYQKLIRGRSSGKAKLSSMTPEELERAAKLEGPGADTVHKLYEQTRYGPGPT